MTGTVQPLAMCRVFDCVMDGGPLPTRRQETAMWLAIECWGLELDEEYEHGRESLKGRIAARWKQEMKAEGKSSFVAGFLLLTVLAAAIEWAVQRLLDWLYPEGYTNFARRGQLLRAKRGAA